MEDIYTLETFPIEIQIVILRNLSLIELLTLYGTSRWLRYIVSKKFIVKLLSIGSTDNWYQYVINSLSKLSPKQLYSLYQDYPLTRDYLNDL